GVGLAGVVDQVHAEVQQRPQRPVGEAVVVGVMVLVRQVERGVLDVAVALAVELPVRVPDPFAAPAEPQAAVVGQRRAKRNGQSTRAVLVGQRDPIGDDHQAAHLAAPLPAPSHARTSAGPARPWRAELCCRAPTSTLRPPRSLTRSNPCSSVRSSPANTGCRPKNGGSSRNAAIASPLSACAGRSSTTWSPACNR